MSNLGIAFFRLGVWYFREALWLGIRPPYRMMSLTRIAGWDGWMAVHGTLLAHISGMH